MSVKLTAGRQTINSDAETIAIGRNAENQLAFPGDARVAEKHALLKSVNGRWIIEGRDGNSIRIGSGRPTQFAWVNSGDVIHLTESGPDIVFEAGVKNENSENKGVVSLPSPFPPPIIGRANSQIEPIAADIFSGSFEGLRPQPTNKKTPPIISKNIATTRQEEKGGKTASKNVIPMMIMASACLIVVILGSSLFSVWMFKSQAQAVKQEARIENDPPSPQDHPDEPVAQSTTPTAEVTVPLTAQQSPPKHSAQEFLVLIGIGELRSDNQPLVLGVGWLWDPSTVVVSSLVAKEIVSFEAQAKQANHPARGCVIQGFPYEIAQVIYPPETEKIALLRLKSPAQLSISSREQSLRVGRNEIETQRMRGKEISYVSYEKLPNSKNADPAHGFPLCEYDPDHCRQHRERAHFIVDAKWHYLSPEDSKRFERGGLLVDEEEKILGMVSADSSVIWTEELEKSLQPR